jgi:hypothetical protein
VPRPGDVFTNPPACAAIPDTMQDDRGTRGHESAPSLSFSLTIAMGASIMAFLSLCLFALSGGETGSYPAGARIQFPFAFAGFVAASLGYIWRERGALALAL